MHASEDDWRLLSPQCECSLRARAARVMGSHGTSGNSECRKAMLCACEQYRLIHTSKRGTLEAGEPSMRIQSGSTSCASDAQRAIFYCVMLNPIIPPNLIMGPAVSHPTQNNLEFFKNYLVDGMFFLNNTCRFFTVCSFFLF